MEGLPSEALAGKLCKILYNPSRIDDFPNINVTSCEELLVSLAKRVKTIEAENNDLHREVGSLICEKEITESENTHLRKEVTFLLCEAKKSDF